jgi:hypothetical protein
MTVFTTFDTFDIDDERQFLGAVNLSEGGNLELEGPVSATFSSPYLESGDTFDILTALSNQSGLDIFVYEGGASSVEFDHWVRGVLLDLYWRDDSLGGIQNVSAYPGIPPRYKLGSYTESVNGIVTNFDYVNYRAQSIGRRVVLLDRDVRRPVWGLRGSLAGGIYDPLMWETPIVHSITLDLNTAALYDANEGGELPLPPNIVPLTSTLYGRAYFYFYAIYDYTWLDYEGNTRLSKMTVYTRPYNKLVPLGVGWYGGSGAISV